MVKRKSPLPNRNPMVMPARMRHAGTMKDDRTKRTNEGEDWSEEIEEYTAAKQEEKTLSSKIEEAIINLAISSPEIEFAYIDPSGLVFWMVGPKWTNQTAGIPIKLAIELQDKFAPDGDPFIEGRYLDSDVDLIDRLPGWRKIFP